MTDNKQKGKYIFSTDFSPKRVNGVNYTCNETEVIISFFEELPSFPDSFEVNIKKDGVASQKDLLKDEFGLVRNIQARIVMKKEEALMLLNYLEKGIESELYDDNNK